MSHLISRTRRKEDKPTEEAPGHLTLRKNLLAQFQEMHIPFEYDSSDMRYEKITKFADPETLSKRVSQFQRRIAVSHSGKDKGKRKEFLTYHINLHSQELGGIEYQVGTDEACQFKQQWDTSGNSIWIPINKKTIYTIPYTGKDQIEKILNDYPETNREEINWSVVNYGGKDFSVTESEFLDLDFQELETRGLTGLSGGIYETSFRISDLSAADRFKLQRGLKLK